MKSNRQIGLDGRVFISDCLNDSIFFIYSIILSGVFSAVGDIMKLLGKSARGMDELTNGIIILDLMCSLGLIIVTYYVYFMHSGENVPKLGTKPLIYLEYIRLAYYGLLAYFVLYRFAYACMHRDEIPVAVPIFYFVYFAWVLMCVGAAMFILTLLHQNVLRRSYEQSFQVLSLVGLVINICLPIVYFITRFWVKGSGDGFYSAGLCDLVRLCIAPLFYSAVWFLYMNAIDQVRRVFGEVDNAIRDKRYHIEFEETEEEKSNAKKGEKSKNKAKSKNSGKKNKSEKKETEKAKKSKNKKDKKHRDENKSDKVKQEQASKAKETANTESAEAEEIDVKLIPEDTSDNEAAENQNSEE